MKVLIAEDEAICREALASSIKAWGYGVVAAKDGEKAWEVLSKDHGNSDEETEGLVRLAIIDWDMPKMDGIELCRKIRNEFFEERKYYIYIILLTGKDSQDDIIKGLSAGADDYVTKPFNFLELKARLKNGERIIQLENRQMELANIDTLTQVWTRAKILDFLDEELERGQRENKPTGAVMIDVDFFKQVNDTHGHMVGDIVLSEVAARLKATMRRYDKIGRYGGDEFLAVFPDCTQKALEQIAKRMLQASTQNGIKAEGSQLNITLSLGGASTEQSSHCSRDTLIEASDRALLMSKRNGRNRYVIVDATASCPARGKRGGIKNKNK